MPDNARADRYDQHVVKVDQVINGNHRFFALRPQQAHRGERLRGFPPEASPWYQHGPMNGLRRGGHIRAQPVARAQLARRLHPPRLLHRHARRQLRSGDAPLPVELHVTAERRRLRRSSGTATARSGARSAATTAASSPSATRGRGPRSARPAATTRSSSAASCARWSTTSRTRPRRRGASPSTARSPSATRWRAPSTAGSSVASLLLGYPADGSTTVRACRRSSRSSTTAGTTSACSCRTTGGSIAADAERRPALGLRAGRRG